MTDTINSSLSLTRFSKERCRDEAALLEKKLLRVKKPLSDFSENADPDMRRLSLGMEIRLSRSRLYVEIKGTPPIPSRNGAIGKAFLPQESSPGLLDQSGAIDFKETNKYPMMISSK